MAFRAELVPPLRTVAPVPAARAWTVLDALPPVHVFAASRTTQTCVVELGELGRMVRKHWWWPRRRDRLKGALRTTWAAKSPARREFEALERLRSLPGGPLAPQALGFLEHRSRGVLRACMLLTTEIAGAADLAQWLVTTRSATERSRVLVHLGQRVREMHDAGLADFEMHPRNVLVVPSSGVVMKVDCAKQRLRAGPVAARDRARDLGALDVGLTRLATAAERAQFLRAYGAAPSLAAAVERARRRVDAREALRLPHAE